MSASDVEQCAAHWLVRREEPTWSEADQVALDAWLAESTGHKGAYWRLEHGWREADRIAALGSAYLDKAPARSRSRRWVALAAAASVFAVLTFGLVEFDRAPRPTVVVASAEFTTPVGGRAIVPLIDGSRVELNTASAMRTRVSAQRREVWLDRGEAYFEIAHRDGLPFVVHAGDRTITVLGTKFSVRRDGDQVIVSVVEGRVKIDDAQRPDDGPAAIITAGDVAVARGPSTLLAPKSEERVESTLAWREGTLVFDRTSLAQAAAEFNRYNAKRIRIGDAETGAIRIGGKFQAGNAEAFVRLLHDAYRLRVDDRGEEIVVSN
ncbi:MAG: FecR domain-containing protein [Sphingomonas sp.]